MKQGDQLPGGIGLAAAAIGLVVLLGWFADVAVLKGILPGLATMKPNTALGFMVGGTALFLLAPVDAPRGRRTTGRILAAGILVLGLITWSEYLTGWHAGIDGLLVPGSDVSLRMSSATALCFLLTGFALVLLDFQVGRIVWPAQWLALGVGTAGLMGVTGYLQGPETLYRVSGFSSMAIHTATGFLMLSGGVLLARPKRGWVETLTTDGFGGVVARYLIPAAVALPLLLVVLRRFGERHHLFDAGQGPLFFTFAYVMLLVALVWWLAATLNRVDAGRREQEERVRLANETLEEQVSLRTGQLRSLNQRLEAEIATRREAEKALRESESRYRSVTEQLPQLVWTCLPDGRCDYLGPQWVAYTGIPEAVQLGYGWAEQVHPDDRKEATEAWQRSASSGVALDTDFRIRRADGVYRWFKTRALPLRGEGGTIVRWFGTNTDIDDQRRTEKALRELGQELENRVEARTRELEQQVEAARLSQERFQRLFDSSPDAILIADRPGRIVQVNEQAAKLFGYTRKELLELEVEALVPGRFRDGHVGHRASFHANPHARPMGAGLELFGLRKDGEEFAIDLLLSPMEEEGRPLVMAVVRDVTERKRAESALRLSEDRFRSAVEYSAIGMALVSLEGRWLQVNPALCEILGYSGAELMKLTFQDITHPDDLDDDLAHVGSLLAGDVTNYQLEKRYYQSSGQIVWAHLIVSLVRGDDGKPVHFVAQIQDVTERVRAREDLERAVAELERSNRDLQQFAYVASHDLQEPLRAVGGCADIFRSRYRGKIDARADELIQHMVDGARRMQRLIHDLLDYSRAGREDGDRQAVDLAGSVATALANLQQQMEDSGAEIDVGTLPTVAGNAGRLAQLFQNLVGNALKYRGERAPHVAISAVELVDRPLWKVSVRDNGIGIEQRFHHKIFGIFQRLHTRSEYEGTGIGLAVCKRIVEVHGGEIWVESAPGEGTTFHFTLPKCGSDGASQ